MATAREDKRTEVGKVGSSAREPTLSAAWLMQVLQVLHAEKR